VVLLDFVRTHTRPSPVPFVPEITLYQADEPIALWVETEASGAEQPPPFWAFAWAGGQALARYLLDHPDLVAGRRVLDVAAGGGIVSIAAALAGASVTALDVDPTALAALALNAAANGVVIDTVLGDVLDADPPAPVDVFTAGDVCYSQAMTERVVGYLQRAVDRGALALIGDPGRAYLPRERCTALRTYPIPTTTALEHATTTPSTVWRLMPRPDRG
jgi:predicted nicotinamide N-methyase